MRLQIQSFLLLVMLFSFTSPSVAQFTEIGGNVGVDLDGNKAGGVAWGDLNNDGCPDILANTDDIQDTRIFLSDCNTIGTPSFTDITATHAAGLLNARTERSAIWADFNNDGYLDFARNEHTRFEVYVNKGPTASPPYSFGTATQAANLVITNISGGMNIEGFGWMDYNGDGWLDLIMENHNYGIDIFQNPADGSANFFHVTPNGSTKGLPTGATTGDYMCLSDYNNDGYVDILARKQNEFDIYQNNGPLAATQFQVNPSFNQQASNGNKGGVLFADFNNDGIFDLYWGDSGTNQIWLGDGLGGFTATNEPATSSGVTLPGNGIDGCAAADVNNDGKIDLFLSDRSGESYLFLNNTPYGGNLSFTRNNLGIDVDGNGEGLAFADFDLDGDQDMYINLDGDRNQLWQNGVNGDNHLHVSAIRDLGSGQWRHDIGATIVLKDCNGNVRSGIRDVNGTRGHGSQDYPKIHFGLPDGPGAVYIVEISFTYVNGLRKVIQKAVIPNLLPDQALVVEVSEVDDLTLCAPLDAAEIATFTAVKSPQGVAMRWRLNMADGGSTYTVERSQSGEQFRPLGVIDGASGNTEAYEFVDVDPLEGTAYYRIYREQADGQAAYSQVLIYQHLTQKQVTLLQHPVAQGSAIALQVGMDAPGSCQFQVFDVQGKMVKTQILQLQTGVNQVQISRESLAPGAYLLLVTGKGIQASEKLLLQ